MKTSKQYLLVAILLLLIKQLPAQLCTGSLGDPIVNITFGAGGNPGPPLSAAAIGYGYTNNDCPNDGSYTIRNITNACFGATWHTVLSDHTGNTNGYFMLINASTAPGDFYVDTVKGLCSGTRYEFSAWVMNVLLPSSCGGNGNKPNITFSIEKSDGAVIQQYNTGDINSTSSPAWIEQGFSFVTPPGVTNVVLRLRNNAPGGCGNDLALDDITFRPCGPVLTSSITGSGTLKEVCEGDTTTVFFQSSISSGYTDPRFQWQEMNNSAAVWRDISAATNANFSLLIPGNANPGDYYFRVTATEAANVGNSSCGVVSQMLVVRVKPKHSVSITNPGFACTGETVSIVASGASAYQWTGPGGFSSTASTILFSPVMLGHAGKYYLTSNDATGCSRKDSATLMVDVKPVASVGEDTVSICKGDDVKLNASGGSSYLWSPAAGLSSAMVSSPNASPGDSTYYQVIISNSPACKDTAYVQVNVFDPPVANAGPDLSMMQGESIRMQGSASGTSVSSVWSPNYSISDVNAIQPLISPLVDTVYILTATSDLGCGVDIDSVRVNVMQKIVVPNVFTPNGDGVNDLWIITGLDSYDSYDVQLYNSYGQLLFKTNSYMPWPGNYKNRPVPVGTYYYIITAAGRSPLSGYVDVVR